MVRGRWRIQWGSLFVGAVVAALLLSSIPVVAAIGDPVLQGSVNTANRRTTLRGTDGGDAMLRVINRAANGSGIEVVVEPGRPPFVVNTSAKVAKLNADRLDGKSIGAFMLKAKYDKDRDLVVDNAERLDGLDSSAFLTRTGAWSCPGNSWVAASTYDDYRTSGPLMSVGFGSASVFFRCGVALPHGVRVSAVTFTVQDSSTIAGVECALFRTGLLSGIGSTGDLASSLITTGTPGATTLTTNQIELSRIDNSKYAYYAGCTVIEDGWDTGIYGVTVSYTDP